MLMIYLRNTLGFKNKKYNHIRYELIAKYFLSHVIGQGMERVGIPEISNARNELGLTRLGEFCLLHHLQNHSKLCSLLSLLQLLLGLAELGQVESCNFLSLLNLLLVSLDLHLQLARQLGHAILVLTVFSLSKSKFFGLAFSTLEGLGSFTRARLGSCKLSFKLTNFHLKLSHGSLASLHCCRFSICKTAFKLSKLVSKRISGRSQ